MILNKTQKIISFIICLILGLGIVITTIMLQDLLPHIAISYILFIIGAIFLIAAMIFLYTFVHHGHEARKITTKEITVIGIQSALSVILYLFVKFPLPFFPGFLDVHISEVPALITSFMYGPYIGSIVILVRFLVKLPTTMTGGVGEMADLIIGLSLIIISSILYNKNRTLKGAIISLTSGILIATVVACFTNYFILLPAYIEIANLPVSSIVSMCSMIPGINEENYRLLYVFGGALPFNLFRFVLVFIITFLLYKRVSHLINKLTLK